MSPKMNERTNPFRFDRVVERVPFRARLFLSSAAVVVLTAALMTGGLYVSNRTQVINGYRERLTAIAHGASIAISADTVEMMVEGNVSIPSIIASSTLREFWRRAGSGDTTATELGDGLALVRRQRDGYHVLAHTSWPVDRPRAGVRWSPPTALDDSLANIRAGRTPLYWLPQDDRLIAVVPVLSSNSIPVALVVATIDRHAALAETRRQFARLAWLPGLALVVALLLSAWLSHQLIRRVARLAEQAEVLARGDLRTDIALETGDELGVLASALRDMTGHLRDVLQEVQRGTGEVADTADALASVSQEMHATSHEVESSARSIAMVARGQTEGIQAIAGMATDAAVRSEAVATQARLAHEATVSVALAAEQVGEAAAEALQRMSVISGVTKDALPAVQELGEKSRRIHVITDTITKIADQSNLLAINAAIEAARAGEHGRGFGIVAQEVRTLSDETAAALRSIHEVASEIQGVSQRTSERIQEMVGSVEAGEVSIQSSVCSVERILAAVSQGREATSGIATEAAAQQERAVAVSEHVRAIAAAAAENAAAASQVSAAVEAQTGIAADVACSSQRLAEVVGQLRGSLVRFQL